jgi:hypothetical protein
VRRNTKRGEQRALRHKYPLKGFSLLGGTASSLREEIREKGKKDIRTASIHLYIFTLRYALCSTTCNQLHSAIGYGLDNPWLRVRFWARTSDFSPLHNVQTALEAHPASYPMGTGVLSGELS